MNRNLLWRRVWLAAAILWMLFIWSNSLRTAAESSQTSQAVLDKLLPLLPQIGLSEDTWHTLIRKAAHIAEFALLGMLWWAVLRRKKGALLLCLLTALTDETIQRFVPGRSGELRDVCIDAAGSALGIAAVCLICRRVVNRRKY